MYLNEKILVWLVLVKYKNKFMNILFKIIVQFNSG